MSIKKLSTKLLILIIISILILSLTGCPDNRNQDGNRDDFDASSYIVSADSEVKGDELEITVVIKDEWQFAPAIEHNLIVNEMYNQIEKQTNKHKNNDDIKSHAIIKKTESGYDAISSYLDTGLILSADGTERTVDEFVIKVDGQLYYGTTEKGTVDSSQGVRGEITSYTKDGSLPVEDEQSNYDMPGAKYTNGGELVQVEVGEDWYNFYAEKRFCKVFSEDEKVEEFLPLDDTIEQAVLSFYNPNEYGMSKEGDRFFMGVINVLDYHEVGDKVQVFMDVHGEGYAVLDDYVKSTHGFGELRYCIFKKDEDDNYVLESSKVHGKEEGEEESVHDFCVSPLDNEFLDKTYTKLFEENPNDKNDKMEEMEKYMLTTYLSYIGKSDWEVKF